MAYPQIKLDHLSRKRQGYYLHAFYSHMRATGMLFLWVRNYRFWSRYKKGFQGGKSIFCIQKGITYGWRTSAVGIPGFEPLHEAKYGLAWKKIPATLVAFTLTRLRQKRILMVVFHCQPGLWRRVCTCIWACATLHILLLFYLRTYARKNCFLDGYWGGRLSATEQFFPLPRSLCYS